MKKISVIFPTRNFLCGATSLYLLAVFFNIPFSAASVLMTFGIMTIVILHYLFLYAIQTEFKKWRWAVWTLSFITCVGELVILYWPIHIISSFQGYYVVGRQESALFFLWNIAVNVSITLIPLLWSLFRPVWQWCQHRLFLRFAK